MDISGSRVSGAALGLGSIGTPGSAAGFGGFLPGFAAGGIVTRPTLAMVGPPRLLPRTRWHLRFPTPSRPPPRGQPHCGPLRPVFLAEPPPAAAPAQSCVPRGGSSREGRRAERARAFKNTHLPTTTAATTAAAAAATTAAALPSLRR